GGLLADRLVEEDHAADELLGAPGREEQLAVGAAVLLGGLDRDRVEALLDGAAALVGGEDALAGRDERAGGRLEIVALGVAHGRSLSSRQCAGTMYRPSPRLDSPAGAAP